LYDYGARFYDPQLGRWIQPDTIVPGSQGVQAWDRFAYVNNNPLKYTDPSGHFAWIPVLAIAGAAIGAVTYAAYNQGDSFDWGECAVAAGVGAVGGALIGSGIGILAGAAAAAMTVSVTTAATATSMIGAGTAALSTGEIYMVNNQNQFESDQYLAQTAIAGTAAYISSNPAVGPYARIGANVAAAELSYLISTDSPSIEGGLIVGAAAFAGSSFGEAVNLTAPEVMMVGSLRNTPVNAFSSIASQYARDRVRYAIYSAGSGLGNGLLTTELTTVAPNMYDK